MTIMTAAARWPTDSGLQSQVLSLICACLLSAIFVIFLRVNGRKHRRRQQGLETAVRERTEELDRERIREKARNHILELLLSNEPLGAVLDKVAQLILEGIPGSHCAILLKTSDRWRVAAAPGFPGDWLAALSSPHAVPFEVWKYPCEFQPANLDPAWQVFQDELTANCSDFMPVAIRTWPIGGPDVTLGAILLFDAAQTRGDGASVAVAPAARLAQVAIEHSRVYDDLQFQANHDALTGLPNRAVFEDRLAGALIESRNLGLQLAVLFVDVDRFKQINDTMSHRVGDMLLCEIAHRMRRVVRPGDTVARIGGDEFNILITRVNSSLEAEEIAGRVLAEIGQPMILDGRNLAASVSIGVAVFPDDGNDADELQREADAAMYCAKGLGRNRVQSFSARNDTLDRARMDREIRAALRDELFTVHYQPKVAADGCFGGLEALARLSHPEYGMISPVEFIPVAEETGLIIPLGAWVLNEVCRQMADWRVRGMGQVGVAVNVSPLQISQPDFAQLVRDCLARHGVSPWSIELELTESMLINGGPESQRQMQDLRAMGVRFSIDDFGTGYSSLSYLHRLQIDAIKLDRSFVQSIDTDPAALRLVQAMIGVAEGLGLNVVAEGVETEAQRAMLIASGCPMMQGFLFSRPQPPADLESYLSGSTSNLDDLLRIGSFAAFAEDRSPVLHPV